MATLENNDLDSYTTLCIPHYQCDRQITYDTAFGWRRMRRRGRRRGGGRRKMIDKAETKR